MPFWGFEISLNVVFFSFQKIIDFLDLKFSVLAWLYSEVSIFSRSEICSKLSLG